jgi:hypothetical protein
LSHQAAPHGAAKTALEFRRDFSRPFWTGNRRSVIDPGGDALPPRGDAVSAFLFRQGDCYEKRTFSRQPGPGTGAPAAFEEGPDRALDAGTPCHRRAGGTRLVIEEGGSPVHYGVTPLARRQLADKLKIPYAYFERMREDQPALLDRNVNTWLQSEEERRMLRTLDGQVRAVLSDRYRRLDNFDLAESVLPILQQLPEVRFESVELTETKMYLKCITPRLKYEMAPGDVVQAGVVISNSEVGQGTLSVQPLLFRLVCSNGLIVPDRSLRKTHVGRALGGEDERIQVYQDDTLRADDKAFFLKVRDVVQAAVSNATFRQTAQKLQKTLNIPLVGDPVKMIEVLAQRYLLNEGERAGVLRHLIAEGELSGYGLVNAVTHYSQEVEDYDRATEFEALGGRLIDLSAHEWKGLAEAA